MENSMVMYDQIPFVILFLNQFLKLTPGPQHSGGSLVVVLLSEKCLK